MLKTKPLCAALCALLSLTFGLSQFLVPNFRGYDPSQFPVPQADPLVVPEGYAFAIWGPIYLWLVVGMAWALLRRSDDAQWHAMRMPLIVSLAVGTLWLPVASVSPVWATVLIGLMFVSTLAALFRAPVGDAWFGALPVGLYAGWLSAATSVSVALLASGYGVLSDVTAALVFTACAAVVGFVVQWRLGRAPTYGFGVIWALVAIAIGASGRSDILSAIAIVGAGLVAVPTFNAVRSALVRAG